MKFATLLCLFLSFAIGHPAFDTGGTANDDKAADADDGTLERTIRGSRMKKWHSIRNADHFVNPAMINRVDRAALPALKEKQEAEHLYVERKANDLERTVREARLTEDEQHDIDLYDDFGETEQKKVARDVGGSAVRPALPGPPSYASPAYPYMPVTLTGPPRPGGPPTSQPSIIVLPPSAGGSVPPAPPAPPGLPSTYGPYPASGAPRPVTRAPVFKAKPAATVSAPTGVYPATGPVQGPPFPVPGQQQPAGQQPQQPQVAVAAAVLPQQLPQQQQLQPQRLPQQQQQQQPFNINPFAGPIAGQQQPQRLKNGDGASPEVGAESAPGAEMLQSAAGLAGAGETQAVQAAEAYAQQPNGQAAKVARSAVMAPKPPKVDAESSAERRSRMARENTMWEDEDLGDDESDRKRKRAAEGVETKEKIVATADEGEVALRRVRVAKRSGTADHVIDQTVKKVARYSRAARHHGHGHHKRDNDAALRRRSRATGSRRKSHHGLDDDETKRSARDAGQTQAETVEGNGGLSDKEMMRKARHQAKAERHRRHARGRKRSARGLAKRAYLASDSAHELIDDGKGGKRLDRSIAGQSNNPAPVVGGPIEKIYSEAAKDRQARHGESVARHHDDGGGDHHAAASNKHRKKK